MKTSRITIALALAAVAAGSTAALALQGTSKEAKPASAPTTDDMEAMQSKWTAYATPGPAHDVLKTKAGNWNFTMKWWMTPGSTPEESMGTSENTWILGDRYLMDETQGTVMGESFTGHGTTGYDNLKKKYVSSWIDNMSTGIMTMEGTYDAATKTFTWKGEGPDPMAGKYMPMRMVERMMDADKWTAEMFCTDHATGKEFKAAEFTYTRAN